jgi:hypothetical protein
MFRRDPAAAEVGVIEQDLHSCANADLVPVSHLKLDLPEQSDWHAYLADRNIEIVEDGIGRASIAGGAARMLIAEERQREQLRREKAAEAERLAVEADEQRRAQIWGGVRADDMPPGVAPAAVMLQSARDSQPKRTTPLQEALSNSGTLTYHPLSPTPEDES